MVSQKTTVVNIEGFHMRPASMFAGEMLKFPCDITLKVNSNTVNGKSLMDIIAACIKCGTEVEIVCNGENEQEALQCAVKLIESGLGD